jgi:hypothetical protein
MAGSLEWVLLAYRLPREPSTVRVGVWRKLRRLGVVQVVDGLVALPLDARSREQFDWVADEVLAAGGEVSVWIGRLGSKAQERQLAHRMADAVRSEYVTVIESAREAMSWEVVEQRRVLARLRRELHRIGRRDFFPPVERERAHRAVQALAGRVKVDA